MLSSHTECGALPSRTPCLPPLRYECYGFQFPDDALYHVTEMSPILDDSLVHHMILYKSPNELGPTEQCFHECVEMPAASTLLYAFAVGMGPFILPPHVGFPVGKFSDTMFTTLQVHYKLWTSSFFCLTFSV